jgi:hypothetical protein
MGQVNLSAALTADSTTSAGLSVLFVFSGHLSSAATVDPQPSVAYILTGAPVGRASVGSALVYRLSSSIVANSNVTASTLAEDLFAPLLADSNVTPNGTVTYATSGGMSSGAHVSSSLLGAYALVAGLETDSSVLAYWGQFLSGTANGVGNITGGIRIIERLSGDADGSASVSPSLLFQTILLSGQAHGFGDFSDDILVPLFGEADGHATLSSPHLSAVLLAFGSVGGSASLFDTGPIPIVGVGTVLGFLYQETIPRPVNHANCPPPLTFRWGYTFNLGDLQLTITDSTGTRYMTPVDVSYTMFQYAKSGVLMQVGPTGKRAITQKNGIFYAVGTAGEGGQPGSWLIRWCYRRTFNGPVVSVDQPFQVVDAISGPIVGDPTCRVTKYGWD